MSQHKLNPDYQNVVQPENREGRSRAHSTPIACIACDKVFFDNVSLVLHFFESHHRDEIPIPGQHDGDLASLHSQRPLSLSLSSPHSSPSVERANATSPRANSCFRHSPSPVSSVKPDLAPTGANPLCAPDLNSVPLISSSYGRFRVPQPFHRSVVSGTSHYGSASSSTHPSQLGPRTIACGPTIAPLLRVPEQNAGPARVPSTTIPRNNQTKEPPVIVLTDSEDEEEGDNKTEELDLTLRL